ncbi:hypothetical protein [Mycobacterium sp. 852014-52450_SCH5900713]|uniref:hypothetical protein n=1 Tax=Mycobacterium sp. 852014-52450_SCH5900713 TaxID=1834116 RepID=UPI0018D47D8C|nr:hypothetical protein [Mycobacterium sp. 852014-52450_SCH5900713]
MGNGQARTAAALCACGAALVLAFGWSAGDAAISVASSSSVTPAPPIPGGALPVQPVGGGGCIIGLNCGCTQHCHQPPRPRPPAIAGDPQHAAPAPAPQNP